MSIFLIYLDHICFTYCVVIILPKFRPILSLCIEIYQRLIFLELRISTPLQEIKSLSPSESLYGNNLQWELNGGKEFYNNISEEVVF